MTHHINNAHIQSIEIGSGPMPQHINWHAQRVSTFTSITFRTPDDRANFLSWLDEQATTDNRIVPGARMELDATELQLYGWKNTEAAFDLLESKGWLTNGQRQSLTKPLQQAESHGVQNYHLQNTYGLMPRPIYNGKENPRGSLARFHP